MSDQQKQQNQQGGQGGQQGGGGQQKPGQQQQQPNQKPGGQQGGGSKEGDQQKQKGGHGAQQQAHATDQISFYDESLKKQIEGSFISDGKSIHVSSAYGVKSFPYNDLGACIDYNSQVLLVRKVLSELARDPGGGKFKDLHQQKDDQQLQPMQKPYLGGASGWGSSGGSGTNP